MDLRTSLVLVATTFSLGLLALPVACSDTKENEPAGDGGLGDAPPTPVLTVRISLETPLDPLKKHRLVVRWGQLNDDGPDPAPETVYDVPFDPAATTITFGAMAPPGEMNLLCERDCTDEAVCPCRANSAYRVGVSDVTIVLDADENGKIETPARPGADAGPTTDTIELIAFGSFTYSPDGGYSMPPSKNGTDPALIDGTVVQGVTLYKAYKKPGAFDRLSKFGANDILEFRVKGPNLT